MPRNSEPKEFRGKSTEGNYAGILRERSRTPLGLVRKFPPHTPTGYVRILKVVIWLEKSKTDSNPPTPKGFMKQRSTAPEHYNIDKNVEPKAQSVPQNSVNDSVPTPRTFVKMLTKQIKEGLTIQSQPIDRNRDRSYSRNRNRSPARGNSSYGYRGGSTERRKHGQYYRQDSSRDRYDRYNSP